MPPDGGLSVVVLGQGAIVGRAQEADVAEDAISAHAEGVPVVELQAVSLGASPTLLVDEAATVAVPFVHRTAHGSGDVARRVGSAAART